MQQNKGCKKQEIRIETKQSSKKNEAELKKKRLKK